MDISFWGEVAIAIILFIIARGIDVKLNDLKTTLERIDSRVFVIKQIADSIDDKVQ